MADVAESKSCGTSVVVTPHPVTLDGQRILARSFAPNERLGRFLARNVPGWDRDEWEVRVDGHIVPPHLVEHLRLKRATLIEVRGTVHRAALQIVALAALTYFTFGIGAATAGLWGAGAVAAGLGGGIAGALGATAVYVGGTILINKVLGPKPPKVSAENDPVHSLTSARNQMRHYQPLPLLFGTVRITPDIISQPYTWFEGNDQYLALVLTPGVNVHRIEALYNGDTPLSSYEGVSVYLNGFGYHANQLIPLWSNVDTVAGAELDVGGDWVVRTSSIDATALILDIEGRMYELSSKGKFKSNSVPLYIQYRPVGAGAWTDYGSGYVTLQNDNSNVFRRSIRIGLSTPGQYDVRLRLGTPSKTEDRDECEVTWVTLKTIQPDTATYDGIPRIAIAIKATGQLSGAMDEVRCVAHSAPVPVWTGSSWVTQESSNPGAHMLQYARGIYDGNGKLIAGMGLSDDQIDVEAFKEFMLHCAANGYTYDAYIKDPRNHQQMLDAMAMVGMGQWTWSGGKLSVVWVAEGQPITAVANMANIKRASFSVNYTLANAADGVEFTYVDASDWQVKTLRVPAPGVTTILNPAQITGEGVTSEEHAAELARWHLAQSIYQYKDIQFAQDLEHLTYRRLSVLSVSHDLTQWGYSGRLVAAQNAGGIITITLDEPVPAPPGGTPYVGLRVPGETAYRVFGCQSFASETRQLTLIGGWPAGVAFPGSTSDNPAHDTIWCYDFKATPGARVRVVQIEPEADLQGARIAVVPETDEFWTFVKTGEYVPPPNISLIPTNPSASDVVLETVQAVVGGLFNLDLLVSFDVAGPMAYANVELFKQVDGAWVDAKTIVTTMATSTRVPLPGPGTYQVVVRPFNSRGVVGGSASATITVEEQAPPASTVGSALNRDPFMLDEDAWSLVTPGYAIAEFVTIDDGIVGTGAVRSQAGLQSRYVGIDRIPIDRNKTYRVSGYLRTLSGSGNTAYLGVALFDADGDNIAGDGSYWYYAASGVTPGGSFTQFSGIFGANTAKSFPANARTMAPIFILGFNPGGGPHNSVHELQGLRIEEAPIEGLVPFLTNEAHTVPAASNGAVSSYAGATGQFKVFAGGADVSANFSLATASGGNPQGLTVNYTDQTYTVTGGLANGTPGATLTIRATGSGAYAGIAFEKTFTLTKSVAGGAGAAGADAKLLYVIADRQTIHYDGNGNPSPSTQTTTFTAQKVNTSAVVTWTVQDINGNTLTPTTAYLSSNTGNSVTMSRAQFDAALAVHGTGGVIVTGAITDGVTLTDKVSVLKVQGGANGGSSFTLQNVANTQITSPTSVTKIGGGNAWNGKAYTLEGYGFGATISAVPETSTGIGLTTDPLVDASYASVDYWLYAEGGSANNLRVYLNGSGVANVGSWSPGDRVTVTSDNVNVRFYKNGSLLYTTPVVTPGATLHGVVTIHPQGSSVSSIAFGPAGAQGPQGPAGPAGAAGQRGSKHFYATGSAWSNTTADNAITAAGYTKVLGDEVTIYNNNGFAETRIWGGSSWQTIGQVINGALIAKGTIFADALALLSSNGQTIDAQAGRIVWSNGALMKVTGVGFGSSSQFIEWFGPYFSNLANCTEANAISYLKTNGAAYFGGSLHAGVLTSKASTSSWAADAEAETAQFGSNGGTISVTVSYSMQGQWSGTGNGSGTTPVSATVYLYRRVGAGSYSHVATLTASGAYVVVSTGGFEFREVAASGSLTYTDPDHNTNPRQYRAVIVARSPQLNPAGYNTGSPSQTLSVVCVEE